MSNTFHCPCGYYYSGEGEPDWEHESESCCNCGGRKCMDCVLRYMHDECEDSCPDCCREEA